MTNFLSAANCWDASFRQLLCCGGVPGAYVFLDNPAEEAVMGYIEQNLR